MSLAPAATEDLTTDDPEIPAPMVSGGGGGAIIVGSGTVTTDNNVAVGSMMTFSVSAPDGYTLDPTTIVWSGGTEYSNYFASAASSTVGEDAGLAAVQLEKNVIKNQQNYVFIVGSEAKDYTVKVNCSYVGPDGAIAAPATTVEFTSVRPEIASLSSPGGIGFSGKVESGEYILKLSNNRAIINAETKAHSDVGGDFMIMQLANIDSSRVDNNGNPVDYTSNGFDFLDDGDGVFVGMGAIGSVGVPPDPDNLPTVSSWSLDAGQTPEEPFAASDGPSIKVPENYIQVNLNDSFSTYLMYRPYEGVWIALSKLEWSYSTDANSLTGTWVMNPNPTINNPTPSTPSGDAAFPNWYGHSAQLQ